MQMPQPSTAFNILLSLLLYAGQAYGAALQTAEPTPNPPPQEPTEPGEPLPEDRLRWHIPDPEYDRQEAERIREEARARGDRTQVTQITRVLERVQEIRRPE